MTLPFTSVPPDVGESDLYADTRFTPVSSFRVISVGAYELAQLSTVQSNPSIHIHSLVSIHLYITQHIHPHQPVAHVLFFLGLEKRKENLPYRIPSPQTDPLRDRAVLLLCFSKLLLRAEGFVGLGGLID